MRVRTLQLIDFKRFNDLTIDLTGHPQKIVALVGPNGSGKSSVFDAIEEFSSNYKGKNERPPSYYQKSIYTDANSNGASYEVPRHIKLTTDSEVYDKKSFYIRSAYRYTSRLNVVTIQALPDAENDEQRPQRLSSLDSRLQDNYARLLGRFYDDVYDKDVTGRAWAEKNVEELNKILKAVLDIGISYLGNPVKNEGTLYFEKGASKRFPYENLSSGEKEVLDIVLDLFVKRHIYANSVVCIDEPELHLNTAIQRKLLTEIEKLVPETSQLWVATHSIGFLRALQEDLRDKTAVIDFSGYDFDKVTLLKPIRGVREDWLRIFATALEDLTGLVAPERIVYCEGRPDPTSSGAEQGLDADVYNAIFAEGHPETLFVSSGGGLDVKKNSAIALRILGKALAQVRFLVLKDRDVLSDPDRIAFLAQDAANRMLPRREIENYVFDKAVVNAFCIANGHVFDESKYDAAVQDIMMQDLKPVQSRIKGICNHKGDMADFKKGLAKFVAAGTSVYAELEAAVF